MSYFYKNMFAYKLKEKERSSEEFEELLKDKEIQPSGKHELKKIGWTNVLKNSDNLFEKVGNAYSLKMKIVEKVIPGSIVKELLEEKVNEIEERDSRKVSKKEKDDLKDALVLDMAAKAFERSSYISGYIDFGNNLLIVDSSSPSKADEFTSLLRATLGSLDVDILEPKFEVIDKMTSWISNPPKNNFRLGESCTLKDMTGTGAKVTVTKQELDVEEITNHIDNGKMVESIELCWEERINFTLTSDFKIKKIKFLDIVTNQIEEDLGESEDEYSSYQSSALIMIGDFAELLEDLNSV